MSARSTKIFRLQALSAALRFAPLLCQNSLTRLGWAANRTSFACFAVHRVANFCELLSIFSLLFCSSSCSCTMSSSLLSSLSLRLPGRGNQDALFGTSTLDKKGAEAVVRRLLEGASLCFRHLRLAIERQALTGAPASTAYFVQQAEKLVPQRKRDKISSRLGNNLTSQPSSQIIAKFQDLNQPTWHCVLDCCHGLFILKTVCQADFLYWF